jgi:DNA-binding transcriptional ArsR family regulator
MGYTVIAPIGGDSKALFVGMKEFPTERVILIAPHDKLKEANSLAKKLETFTIETKIIDIHGSMLEEMFRVFGELCSVYDNDGLVVNVGTGDKMTTCAAISAAYANGLKTFEVSNNMCMLLPIMKLSYYNELSDNKMKILKELKVDDFISLGELNKKLGMSISLLSYHINGNYKYKGLKEHRLVDVKEQNNNLLVKLSDMGNLLLKGYIQPKDGGE